MNIAVNIPSTTRMILEVFIPPPPFLPRYVQGQSMKNETISKRVGNLMSVKSLVTLALTAVFAVFLQLMGRLNEIVVGLDLFLQLLQPVAGQPCRRDHT